MGKNELSGGINPETLEKREMNSGAMFNELSGGINSETLEKREINPVVE